MDGQHFDSLVRSLASFRSRRALLRSAAAAAVASLGAAFGPGDAGADLCKADGKECKKDSQCCSGTCVPSSGGKKDWGVCCTPVPAAEACAGSCGQVVDDGCGGTYQCGLCADEICIAQADCNSGTCCQGSCCDEDRSPTAACCPHQDRCCECFQDNSSSGSGFTYCDCPAHRELCGTYPNDECCQDQDTCVDGACVPKEMACPPADDPDGPKVDCRAVGSGCCNGVCCPLNTTCDATGQCVAELPVCTASDPCTDGGICTATDDSPVGICCPGNRFYEFEQVTVDGTFIVRDCCSLGNEARGCTDEFCTPVTYMGCDATFRGSQPRITS